MTKAVESAEALAEMRTQLAGIQDRFRQGPKIEMIPVETIPVIKKASLRIGILHRQSGTLINMGSGTLIQRDTNDGPLVVTAAHLFVDEKPFKEYVITVPTGGKGGSKLTIGPPDGNPSFEATVPRGKQPGDTFRACHPHNLPNPYYRKFRWVEHGAPAKIDWNLASSEVVIAIGVYEGDDKPSRWKYWAELVTPLNTLAKLVDHPDSGKDQVLQDLAIIRIRGSLDMAPNVFTDFESPYTSVVKHGSFKDGSSLPQGLALATKPQLDELESGVATFGWSSPDGKQIYLHAQQPKAILFKGSGALFSEPDNAGSGGAACDSEGRLVAVNSFTYAANKTALRMVSAEEVNGLM